MDYKIKVGRISIMVTRWNDKSKSFNETDVTGHWPNDEYAPPMFTF